MRPKNLFSKIFLDSCDPAETRKTLELLGFLDGQTTNPTLVAKNPQAKARLEQGQKFHRQEILDFYRQTVTEIAALIPEGSVSIEVYADQNTTPDEMMREARVMFGWIDNAHIKLPITPAGLTAAGRAVKEKMRLNMTLCFNQAQAAGGYAATKGTPVGSVFVSPFIGRLDDQGENGLDLIKNILTMYQGGDGHVSVLAASVRTLDHFYGALQLPADIITAPFKVLKSWADQGLKLPDKQFVYDPAGLRPIAYQKLNLRNHWRRFSLVHPLTDQGLIRFTKDWNQLIRD